MKIGSTQPRQTMNEERSNFSYHAKWTCHLQKWNHMSFSDPESWGQEGWLWKIARRPLQFHRETFSFHVLLLIGVSFERLPLLNSLFFSSFFAFSGQKELESSSGPSGHALRALLTFSSLFVLKARKRTKMMMMVMVHTLAKTLV